MLRRVAWAPASWCAILRSRAILLRPLNQTTELLGTGLSASTANTNVGVSTAQNVLTTLATNTLTLLSGGSIGNGWGATGGNYGANRLCKSRCHRGSGPPGARVVRSQHNLSRRGRHQPVPHPCPHGQITLALTNPILSHLANGIAKGDGGTLNFNTAAICRHHHHTMPAPWSTEALWKSACGVSYILVNPTAHVAHPQRLGDERAARWISNGNSQAVGRAQQHQPAPGPGRHRSRTVVLSPHSRPAALPPPSRGISTAPSTSSRPAPPRPLRSPSPTPTAIPASTTIMGGLTLQAMASALTGTIGSVAVNFSTLTAGQHRPLGPHQPHPRWRDPQRCDARLQLEAGQRHLHHRRSGSVHRREHHHGEPDQHQRHRHRQHAVDYRQPRRADQQRHDELHRRRRHHRGAARGRRWDRTPATQVRNTQMIVNLRRRRSTRASSAAGPLPTATTSRLTSPRVRAIADQFGRARVSVRSAQGAPCATAATAQTVNGSNRSISVLSTAPFTVGEVVNNGTTAGTNIPLNSVITGYQSGGRYDHDQRQRRPPPAPSTLTVRTRLACIPPMRSPPAPSVDNINVVAVVGGGDHSHDQLVADERRDLYVATMNTLGDTLSRLAVRGGLLHDFDRRGHDRRRQWSRRAPRRIRPPVALQLLEQHHHDQQRHRQ